MEEDVSSAKGLGWVSEWRWTCLEGGKLVENFGVVVGILASSVGDGREVVMMLGPSYRNEAF